METDLVGLISSTADELEDPDSSSDVSFPLEGLGVLLVNLVAAERALGALIPTVGVLRCVGGALTLFGLVLMLMILFLPLSAYPKPDGGGEGALIS